MNEWTIYWITRLDGIKGYLFDIWVLTLLIFIFSLFLFGIFVEEYNDIGCKKSKYMGIISGVLCLIIPFIYIFIPTTKEMLLIKGVPAIVNSKETGKLRVALNKLLDKYINNDNKENK